MCKDLHNRVTVAPQPLATQLDVSTIRAFERERSTTIREENWHAFGKHHAGKSDSWATDFGNQASNVVIENHSRRFLKLGNQMQSVPVDVRVKANSMLKAKTMTSITGEVRGVGRVKAAPKRVSSKSRQGTFLQRSRMKSFGRTVNARGQPHMVQHPDPT